MTYNTPYYINLAHPDMHDYSPDSAIASVDDHNELIEQDAKANIEEDDLASISSWANSGTPNFSNMFEQILKSGSTSDAGFRRNVQNLFNMPDPFDWLNDEDLLFGRMIGLRMKTLKHENKREVKGFGGFTKVFLKASKKLKK